MACVSQPIGPQSVGVLIGRIDDSVDRLLASASGLSDEDMREPSLLPGWSRGHVLTHVARNADGLGNLLTWAKTGVATPQYPSREVRDAQIDAGAGRSSDEILADLARSARIFVARARELSAAAWLTEVRGLRGPAHPAWFTLRRRLSEVEIHHVDLDAGYRPADWPDWLVSELLHRVSGQLREDPASPDAELRETGTGTAYLLRPDANPAVTITGPGHALLAWLLGRSAGGDLSADPAGPLPSVPPY
jgi:maleylpyruvate isomerase